MRPKAAALPLPSCLRDRTFALPLRRRLGLLAACVRPPRGVLGPSERRRRVLALLTHHRVALAAEIGERVLHLK